MKSYIDMTINEMFDDVVSRFGNKKALNFVNGKSYTYKEIKNTVSKLANFLKNHGVDVGERVAILSENQPNWGINFFAIVKLGAIAVPILTEFRENEIHHILKHSGTKVVFVSQKLYSKLENINIDSEYLVIMIDDFSVIPPSTSKNKLREIIRSGSEELFKIKNYAFKKVGLMKTDITQDDIASIIYTSGTTGHSKGVMLSHRNLMFDAVQTKKIQPVEDSDRLLSILPLAHTYEFTLGFLLPFMSGAEVYYLSQPPAPKILIPALQKIKPTLMLAVPLLIEKIYKNQVLKKFHSNIVLKTLYAIHPIRKFLNYLAGKKLYHTFGGKLHFFGVGGALLAPETERFLRDSKFPYSIGYGLTETSPLSVAALPKRVKFRSTGKAIPGVKIRIVDINPATGEGEIQIKGDNVMKGYYKDEIRTKEVITEDGWFRTGDLGVLKRGHLYIKGRSKNMILGPSGENIYPEELESVINEYDFVMESLVHEKDGRIYARVYFDYEQLDSLFGKNLSESSKEQAINDLLKKMQNEVNSRIATYARIHEFKAQLEPFEKTPTQKIKRYLYD